MYFLGLDPSTKCTGYCVMDIQYEIIEKGKIDIPADETEAGKILYQIQKIEEILNRYTFTSVLSEDQFQQFNVDTLKKLSKTTGAVMYICKKYTHEPGLIYPSAWRKIFHGSGKATKKDTFKKVVTLYELSDLKFTKDNDMTDAIGIAWACVDLHKAGAVA